MNVRVFLLIAMTAFFGVLWSSDREYQAIQTAAARAGREKQIARAAVVAPKPVGASAASSVRRLSNRDGGQLIVNAVFGSEMGHGVTGLVRWSKALHAWMEEKCCTLRWRARKAFFFHRRRAAALMRGKESWHEIAARLGNDAIRRLEADASAAVPATVEMR